MSWESPKDIEKVALNCLGQGITSSTIAQTTGLTFEEITCNTVQLLKEPDKMQERAIKTRNKILTTAIELFAACGFHGTKIDAIAAAAKVNKQRIYAYFGNKRQLFEQSLMTLFSEVNHFEEATLHLEQQDLSRLSEILLRKYMDLHDRYPNFLRLLAWANLEAAVPVEQLLNIKNDNFSRLKQYFTQACETGFVQQKISFETWIFNIMAAAWFYHSNQQTLKHTLSEKMFTAAGRERYIIETARQFDKK